SKKEKAMEEFSDEQIEKLLDYRHDKIQEKMEEIKKFVRTYPGLSMTLFFTLGLLFGIHFSENSR
ncbi:MAG: hypothetical protein O2U61_02595, partial [Candidatus Bathyarchaeota archaeon]|nr:hypothetical protein [Candidatus Bathyarchaeota archaeon]